MLETPVAFFIFNRPRHTSISFSEIKKQQPKKLFIVADGPRGSHPGDAEKVEETRRIIEEVNWPCELEFNFSSVNLGCRKRVITGLDWLFSKVDRAIIIEDDIVPNPDFFEYCSLLLEKYKDRDEIMAITGDNFQDGMVRGEASYYFSKYAHIWGWATWARAWKHNDPDITFWPTFKKSKMWKALALSGNEKQYWEDVLDKMHAHQIDTWDYSWMASIWYQGGLTITPNVNLVSNIGIGPEGTHLISPVEQEGLPSRPLKISAHPKIIQQDIKADMYAFKNHFGGSNIGTIPFIKKIPKKINNRIKNLWNRIYEN